MARESTIQFLRGTSTTSTETLAAGEPYFNTATGDLVIGDNTTAQQIASLVNSNKIIPNINTILEMFNIPIFDANTLNLSFDTQNYTASVVALPNSAKYSGSIVIPEKVYKDKKIYTITSIGNRAFYDCPGLTTITIPDSVTSIGYEVFFDCTTLTSIMIPDGVMSIGHDAFSYCSVLTSITIPSSVMSIGSYAFEGCASLSSIIIQRSDSSTISGSPWGAIHAIVTYYRKVTDSQIDGWELSSNKVTSISSSSTDTQYPSAKCVYDLVGNINTLLINLNTGSGV